MRLPSKRIAIRNYCLECSCASPKVAVLCDLFDCPLWPFRLGATISTSTYRKRIESAFKNHRKDVAALAKDGITKEDFLRIPQPDDSASTEAEDED